MWIRVLVLAALAGSVSARAAAVHGTVTFPKVVPGATLPVTRDQGVCGAQQPDESLVVSSNRGLKNVVVFVTTPPPGAPTPAPTPNAVLDQTACRYTPHVQAVQVGTQLVAVNSDAMLHTVRGTSNGQTLFNKAQPLKGMKSTSTLSQPGLVHVGCDAGHTWMSAWVYVFAHPYYAVTAADGTFSIEGLPAGTYDLSFWHETLGTIHRTVRVGPGDATVSVTLAPP